MTLAKIIECSGGSLVVILLLIEISPLKINPWKWIGKTIGNWLMSDVNKYVKEVDKKITDHIDASDLEHAKQARERIVRFNDGLVRGDNSSKEYFDQILEDIDYYERYCKNHPEYPNNKAVFAIKNIKENYAERMKNGNF